MLHEASRLAGPVAGIDRAAEDDRVKGIQIMDLIEGARHNLESMGLEGFNYRAADAFGAAAF
jgi:hypothetical protein